LRYAFCALRWYLRFLLKEFYMIRRDYIIRLIEEFGILWARLVAQVRGGDLAVARVSLDHAYMHTLGLASKDAQTLGAGDLLARMQLGFPPEVGRERCRMLCALLQVEGNIALHQGNPSVAAESYRTALLILRVTVAQDATETRHEYAPQIADLEAAIAEAERA
jgi:hypothetical protein